jgi:hypothetical protein
MVKEVEILKGYLKNSYNFFAFSCKWVGERSVVARLGRASYFSRQELHDYVVHGLKP